MQKQTILLFIVLTLAFTGGSRLLAQGDEIHWLDSYRETIQEAKRTQKPIFLEFRCEP